MLYCEGTDFLFLGGKMPIIENQVSQSMVYCVTNRKYWRLGAK